ncbi:putative N-acetylneuraminate transporter [Grimontia indica]|uniref:TRAP transporter small permease protein n=1 Tax=Grimontia indica TaxID=1056512 RepID=R1J317_9GAMM|nr:MULTISPECIES: TRAP transporter small permease subunit [Grimontia]EOD81960.1 putative N-acetylneuraminate transporter [Grimontia indica]
MESSRLPEDKNLAYLPAFLATYVRFVESINFYIGRFAMYLIFLMLGILVYSSVTKTFFLPSLWTLEMAQFAMVAYYMLGGPYSMQLNSHVRMDLVYGNWSPRTKAMVDSFTVIFLIVYLVILLYGGISSTSYALEYGERSYSAWRPYMAPIKLIMCFSIFLMLLQATAVMLKDIAKLRAPKGMEDESEGGTQ